MSSSADARIGVAFIIMATSFAGVLPPILSAMQRSNRALLLDSAGRLALSDAAMLRVKAFAAGVLLSLSIVHVCYDAFVTLGEVEASENYALYNGYSMAGPFIVFGILLCVPRVWPLSDQADLSGSPHATCSAALHAPLVGSSAAPHAALKASVVESSGRPACARRAALKCSLLLCRHAAAGTSRARPLPRSPQHVFP